MDESEYHECWPWHNLRRRPGPDGLTRSTTCHRRSSAGWKGLFCRSAEANGLRVQGGSTQFLSYQRCSTIPLDQKAVSPVLMGVKKPEQACTLRQFEEETKVIPLQPAVKGPIANSLEGKQHPQGNDFTRVEIGLAVLGHVFHRIANLAEQINEIIFSGLEVSPFAVGLATYSLENLETFFNKNQ